MKLIYFLCFHLIVLIENINTLKSGNQNIDTLTPYIHQHGSRLSHRSVRECHMEKYGTESHALFPARKPSSNSTPSVVVKRFVRSIKSNLLPRVIRGHLVIIPNPLATLSVLEPNQPGGCALNIRQTVVETAKKEQCVVAMNAGYFDTKQGKCLGNVISDGKRVHDSKGIQNAHFGLTQDGQIFTGYLSEDQFLHMNLQQLVGGVIWLLKNGTKFVNDSSTMECESTEETGPMENFINIVSARTAAGHDKDGNVILVQVDGKSNIDGINLYEMETLLQEFGVVNAINLDGGGSASLVINGSTVNYPYDECDDVSFSCDRKVSTILCIHNPYCDPRDCNKHGSCVDGNCVCDKNWLPPKCDLLFCEPGNCSGNGVCLSGGCVCHPGHHGENCDESCNEGWFGSMCKERCKCLNSAKCHPATGACLCNNGFTGDRCEHKCDNGFFGPNCQFKCNCNSSCYCDPVDGRCDITENTTLYIAAHCLAEKIIQREHLVNDKPEERKKWYFTMIVLGSVTAVCLTAFIIILFSSCSCFCQNEQSLCSKRNKKRHRKKYPLKMPSGLISDSSDSESYSMERLTKN